MPAELELPARPIVDSKGAPVPWFAQMLKDTIATNSAISNLAGNADDLADGITRRIREIAREEIAYNGDGTISTITYKDPDTDATLLTESVSYTSGQVTQIQQVDSQTRTTTYAVSYTDDLVVLVEPSFSGF